MTLLDVGNLIRNCFCNDVYIYTIRHEGQEEKVANKRNRNPKKWWWGIRYFL